MGPVDSSKRISNCSLCRAITLLLMTAVGTLGRSQLPVQAHPPSQAILALPRVQVPDVRGRQAQDAEVTLRNAGLTPGKVSSAAGPGIVGTALQQDPRPNSVVVQRPHARRSHRWPSDDQANQPGPCSAWSFQSEPNHQSRVQSRCKTQVLLGGCASFQIDFDHRYWHIVSCA